MESEIEQLRQRITELEAQNQGQKERPQLVKEALQEHFEKKPEDVLPQEKQASPQIIAAATQKITDLKKDEGKHQEAVKELLEFASQNGIINAAKVVQEVDDPHLIDDFQAALSETFFKIH